MEVRLRRPTTETLAALGATFLVQQALLLVAPPLVGMLFVLSAPGAQPWALVTSVYAHASLRHLLSNAVGVVLFGLVVERVTTRERFHAFFVGVGGLAGLAEVLVQGALGTRVGIVGASGAVLGLLGYLLASNAVTRAAVGRFSLSGRQQAVVFGVVAVALTLTTVGPRVAVVGHFTGLVLGLAAGRLRLLHA